MDEALPWISQGDILTSAPQVGIIELVSDRLKTSGTFGPALVFTHDCALDKRTSSAGKPQIQTVQLLPIRDVAAQTEDRQKLLRREDLPPYEVLYLGDLGDWEGFVALTELYSVPAQYFEPALTSFAGHPQDPDGEPHLTFDRHGDRLGRLEPERLELLHRKVMAFWLRTHPE